MYFMSQPLILVPDGPRRPRQTNIYKYWRVFLAAPGGHGTWKGAGAASSFAQKRSESDKKMVLWDSILDFLSVSQSLCHSFLLWENVI